MLWSALHRPTVRSLTRRRLTHEDRTSVKRIRSLGSSSLALLILFHLDQYHRGVVVMVQLLEFVPQPPLHFSRWIIRPEHLKGFIRCEDLPETVSAYNEPAAFGNIPMVNFPLVRLRSTDAPIQSSLVRMCGQMFPRDRTVA